MSEIKFNRESSERCSTYFDTAKEIAKIQFPVGSEQWLDAASRKIKRYGHHEKLGVHSNLTHGFLDVLDKEWGIQHLKDFVAIKLKTHKDFAYRSDEEIM